MGVAGSTTMAEKPPSLVSGVVVLTATPP